MALILKDRVQVISTTTGTGTLTLGAAVDGYQSFSVIGDGNTTYYTIVDKVTSDWEVGVGTYTASGTTLSRDTILASSTGGSAIDFAAGDKNVFVTYPAEKGVWLDASNKLAQSDFTDLDVSGTATINTATITSGTVSTTPASATDIANKQYVDNLVSSGITYHAPVKYEVPDSTGNLNATYNNGTAGVGATLTNAGTQTAFTPDGVVAQVGDRVLVYNQTNAYENGVYTVTTVGSGSTNWVLTRATDADSYGLKDLNALGNGDAFFITSGNTGAGETYVCNTVGTITFGTTPISFTQISSTQIYSAGTGLTLTNTTFSLTNTGTAGTYGSVTQVPVLTTNAQGQVTNVTNTSIAIPTSQITSGTLPVVRGGTGLSTIAAKSIPVANTADTYTTVTPSAGQSIRLNAGGAAWEAYTPTFGTVTSVSGTSPVSSSGGATPAISLASGYGDTQNPYASKTANYVLAAPNGSAGVPTFRAIAAADIPTLNQNTTGSAGSVANSVTFNNGGSGAASGTTFNGSSAQTISYNTVGAPSTTGTNASGTWSISISGNAATATSAGNADTLDGQHGSYYQPASTAITTSNIGSQSVNYATSAGNADTLDGQHGAYYQPASTAITTSNIGSQSVNYATSAGSATDSTKLPLAGGNMTGGFKEAQVAMGANNIDLATGNFFSKTISGATSLTVSNVPASGTAASIILNLTNGGSASITWWSGMKWAGGTAPTLTASGRDVLGFFTYDGGTIWTGLLLGKDIK